MQQQMCTESEMVKPLTLTVIFVLLLAVTNGTVVSHCVKTCKGINNGDYNSCDGCAEFITCSEGTMSKTPCTPGTLFDADRGICDWTSNTCTESVSTRRPADTTAAETTSKLSTSERTSPLNNLTPPPSSLGAQTTPSQINDNDISGPTSSFTTQSSSPAVQTTQSHTNDNEMSSLTSSYTIQSISPETETRVSQSITNETASSPNNLAFTSSFTHPQTTNIHIRDDQTSASTIQSDSSRATAQTTVNQADAKTFHYVRVHYEIAPCVADADILGSVQTRSKIECGSICKRSTKCWYFQHTARQCLMYERTSPPCSTDIYRYDDDGDDVGGGGVDENDVGGDGEGGDSAAGDNDENNGGHSLDSEGD